MAVLNLFLRLDAWRIFFQTYRRIIPSPTARTIELFEEGDFRSAMKFGEVAITVSTIAALSTLIKGKELLTELLYPLSMSVSMVGGLILFYWMTKRRSPVRRTSREAVLMAMLIVGFVTPPIFAVTLALLLVPPSSLSPALSLAMILALWPVIIAVLVHDLRCWKYFWRLRKRRILFNRFAAGIVPGIAGTSILLLLGIDPMATAERRQPAAASSGATGTTTYSSRIPMPPAPSATSRQPFSSPVPRIPRAPGIPFSRCQAVIENEHPFTEGLVSSFACLPTDLTGPEASYLYRYDTREHLYAIVATLIGDLPSDTCPAAAAQTYTNTGKHSGRLACYLTADDRNAILWTEDDELTITIGLSTRLSPEELLSWRHTVVNTDLPG
ncbi:hypothetical protein UG55_11186 [Frankia sp. EI5c]|nr:hypothetical protein UG55_11186 [Frankia sp. EI5c]